MIKYIGAFIIIGSIAISGIIFYAAKPGAPEPMPAERLVEKLREIVLPEDGVTLPVTWGTLGKQMVESGVIDPQKFEIIFERRNELTPEIKQLLYGENNDNLIITRHNSGAILNLLWALGLGTKNNILENGPMVDTRFGGAGGFASTGGWTLAKGNTMNHYSAHEFIKLTPEQQLLVESVSKNIFRPCCNNPTHFPDCNHGMAMLGLLQLMSSQNVSEDDMYRYALAVNSYWFPNNYLTIALFLKENGDDWIKADPKEILGANFSSGSGFAYIEQQIIKPIDRGGAGCGV